MESTATRREFLAAAAVTGVGLSVGGSLAAAPFKTTLKKALIGKVEASTLDQWKQAGFDGMEANVWNVTPDVAEKSRRLAEKAEMRIHSVMRGWANFNSRDAAVVEKDINSVRTALRAAQAYGADAVLLVPCRIGVKPTPEPWEFNLQFDPKTGYLKQVVAGDNSRYDDYIAAHNQSVDTSRAALEKLIPVAEEAGVVIAVENVWNNLWVKPDIFANFVKSFDNRWIQAYYDIGNHVKYAAPQEWLKALGKLIVKVHVKDFKLNDDGHGGKFCDIRDGSVDFPAVRKILDEIGYNGWMTIEGSGRLSVEERSKRLDLIIAGK